MIETLIIGLNERCYDLVRQYPENTTIIDLGFINEYITFNHQRVAALYQASLLGGLVEHESFEDAQAFFEQVSIGQQDLEYQSKKNLLSFLKSNQVPVIKGKIEVVDEHHLKIKHLNEETILEFNQLINNVGIIEVNPYESPFVFSFNELLNSNLIFKKILVVAKSLRALEIASLYRRFGSEVTLVTDRKTFTQIEHLLFRDAIRESLIDQGVTLLEKYQVDSIDDREDHVVAHIEPISQLAFEIGEPLVSKTLEFDAIVIESEAIPFELEHSQTIESINQQPDILFIEPALALTKTQQKGETYQFDVDEFTYFLSRLENNGGLEFNVFQDKISGFTYYCHNAIELKQLTDQLLDKTLSELSSMNVLSNSLMGVIKEAAIKMSNQGDQYARH